MQAPETDLQELGAHHGDCLESLMRAGRELHNGYRRAFFNTGKAEVVNRVYTILYDLLVTNVC